MNPKRNFRAAPILIILALVLAQLACGINTVQPPSSAVPPTSTSRAATAKPPNPPQPVEIPPTATTVPPASPVSIISQGFGQSNREVGYAFIVENPDQAYAVENSQYQVAAYDANNTVVETDSGYIDLLLPGQKLGLAGTIYLDEGITVAKVEAQLIAGDPASTGLTASLTADKAYYRAGDTFSKAYGVINNSSERDPADLRVSAVLYNAAGEIIGGGYQYLNFVLRKSAAGVEVMVAGAGEVARVELYAAVSSFSLMGSGDQPPAEAQAVLLSKSGFSQVENEIGYGMLIQNPNAALAVSNSMYQVTYYGGDGNVVATDNGYIYALLPGQALGVAGTKYLDEGLSAAKAVFQVETGEFEAFDPLALFTAGNVKYLPDPYYPQVSGEINNPYGKDITNLRVDAIAYNEAGDIIGGGYTYLDFVPANSKAAVKMGLTCAGTPAKVEFYAMVSALTDLR